jgi:Na+/H+ antiporter NhaC
MLLSILVILAILCALITITSFVFYVRARLAERAHPDDEDVDVLRDAGLDRKERLYQTIHFLSLLIFVILGVLILIIMS